MSNTNIADEFQDIRVHLYPCLFRGIRCQELKYIGYIDIFDPFLMLIFSLVDIFTEDRWLMSKQSYTLTQSNRNLKYLLELRGLTSERV